MAQADSKFAKLWLDEDYVYADALYVELSKLAEVKYC